MWSLCIVFLLLWLLGWAYGVGGIYIHALLVCAAIVAALALSDREPPQGIDED